MRIPDSIVSPENQNGSFLCVILQTELQGIMALRNEIQEINHHCALEVIHSCVLQLPNHFSMKLRQAGGHKKDSTTLLGSKSK